MNIRMYQLAVTTMSVLFIALTSCPAGALQDPNTYHWRGEEQFFEGWYFKVSDPATQKSFLFIYAVFNPDGMSAHSQAFMMVGNNSPGVAEAIFESYDVQDFNARYDVFDASIGDENYIYGNTEKLHLQGAVDDGKNSCRWNIDLSVSVRWADTMGWMAYLKNLQTYWHVGAMDALATGWIEWNGELFEFEDILGYQEKNWGREFPTTWLWLQANNFDDPRACCLSIGGGSMPVGPLLFDACGIGFYYNDRLYTFSFPQQPVRIVKEIVPGSWQIEARKSRHSIRIDGSCDPGDLINLMNPTEDGIRPYTWETLAGTVRVRLYEKQSARWQMIVDTTSDLAGLEVGGEHVRLDAQQQDPSCGTAAKQE